MLFRSLARDPERAAAGWCDLAAARLLPWSSQAAERALATATLVVNATPLAGGSGPVAIERLAPDAAVIDLVYGPEVTPWVQAARAAGHPAWDGLGLLVHQARRSLERWTGCEVPVAPLAAAVGWPR